MSEKAKIMVSVKRNYLISTEMHYKPYFNGYTGINKSHKTL